jgi:hypothetical protein
METQKFIVTSKRNDYLYAYHTEYEVGDDNDRETAMEAIDRCRPPLLDLNIEEVMKRPRRSMFVYTIDLKYTELVDLCYTCKIKMYFDIDFEYPIIEIL